MSWLSGFMSNVYIVAFLFMIPIGALFSALSFDQNDLAKVIVFF